MQAHACQGQTHSRFPHQVGNAAREQLHEDQQLAAAGAHEASVVLRDVGAVAASQSGDLLADVIDVVLTDANRITATHEMLFARQGQQVAGHIACNWHTVISPSWQATPSRALWALTCLPNR